MNTKSYFIGASRGHLAGLLAILILQFVQPAQAGAAAFMMMQNLKQHRPPDFLKAPPNSTGFVLFAPRMYRHEDGLLLVCAPGQELHKVDRCLINAGSSWLPRSVPGEFVTAEDFINQADPRAYYNGFAIATDGTLAVFFGGTGK